MQAHTSDKRRNQGDASLGACYGLCETKEQGEVAVDGIVTFELFGGLDAFPGGGYFDEDALFGDADGFVESDELFSLRIT